MWSVIASAIILAGIAITFIENKYAADVERARENYVLEQAKSDAETSVRVESSLSHMFQGLRTIARLPGVRKIDRYATNFSADSRSTVQEIYNNLAASVDISEVYIVPADLEPDRVDPRTGKNQEPITTFDHLIVGRNAGGDPETHEAEPLEEIEIYEYRLMKEQIFRLKAEYPTASAINGLNSPGIIGPEVVTCDNRYVNPKNVVDKDRSGMIFSVPFYGPDGNFKGVVAGVLLSRVVEKIIRSPDVAVVNPIYNYVIASQGGEVDKHRRLVDAGRPATDLVYSRCVPLNIPDLSQTWRLWSARPDAAFTKLPVLRQAANFRLLARAATLILIALLVVVTVQYERRQVLLAESNQNLEVLVGERTTQLEAAQFEIVYRLAKTTELRDAETGNHNLRVAYSSKIISETLGFDAEYQRHLFLAAMLHDIGKIGIRDAILLKPGKLTSEEFAEMRNHTIIGEALLASDISIPDAVKAELELVDLASSPFIQLAGVIASQHHEKFDGEGYPMGLVGEEIDISARIVAVADVFDALRSSRPYKRAMTEAEAVAVLKEGSGKHFDPAIVTAFCESLPSIREVYLHLHDGPDSISLAA